MDTFIQELYNHTVSWYGVFYFCLQIYLLISKSELNENQ